MDSVSLIVSSRAAILVLEAMVVRVFRPPNSPAFMAIVGQLAWESQFDVRGPAWHIEQFDVRGQSVRAEGEALTLLRILDIKMIEVYG